MTVRYRRMWPVLLGLALALAACASPPVVASPDPSTVSGSLPAPGASGLAAPLDPVAPAIDLVDPAGSMVAAEIALRQQDRERAGLVNLGPGALELAAAMDASETRVLQQVRAEAGAGVLIGHVASNGVFAPEPGFNAYLVWATLITTLGDFAADPTSGTVEAPPETIEIAGNSGTITTTMTLNAVVNGSQLMVDISIKTKGQVADKATGAILYSIDSIATGHVDVDFCPDTGGRSTANVKLTSSEIYVQGGGAAKGISKDFAGSVTISVDDDAKISRVEGAAQASEDSKGGVPPVGGSESGLPVATRRASDNIANDGNGRRLPDVPRDIKFGGEGSTVDQQVKFWGSMSLFVETMVTAAAREAEKLWRSGKCVELVVDPDGRDVEPDAVETVTATLKHKIEGNELDKPVEATLTGVKSLDPDGDKQPAPAIVTYTAGPNDGDVGKIAFKSVSNRGIAQKTVIFTVRPAAWLVTFKGTDTEVFGPIANNFKAEITGLRITAAEKVLSGTGKLRLTGTVKAGVCTGPLDQVASSTITGTLIGTGPEAVLRIVILTTSPPGEVVHMQCQPGGGADIPAEGHAERFGEALLEFDLPVGGTVDVSRKTAIGGIFNVTVKGTFTVTEDEGS